MNRNSILKIMFAAFTGAGLYGGAIAQSFPETTLSCKPKKGAVIKVELIQGIGSVRFPHIFIGDTIYAVNWVSKEAIRAIAQKEKTHLLLRRDNLNLFVMKDEEKTGKAKVVSEYKCKKLEMAL